MKPLLDLADRHTLGTGVVGTISGLASWLLSQLDLAATIAGKLAVVLTCISCALVVAIQWLRYRRERREDAQAARLYRKLYPRGDGEDEGDRLP